MITILLSSHSLSNESLFYFHFSSVSVKSVTRCDTQKQTKVFRIHQKNSNYVFQYLSNLIMSKLSVISLSIFNGPQWTNEKRIRLENIQSKCYPSSLEILLIQNLNFARSRLFLFHFDRRKKRKTLLS